VSIKGNYYEFPFSLATRCVFACRCSYFDNAKDAELHRRSLFDRRRNNGAGQIKMPVLFRRDQCVFEKVAFT
jgi:hypothetical protein